MSQSNDKTDRELIVELLERVGKLEAAIHSDTSKKLPAS